MNIYCLWRRLFFLCKNDTIRNHFWNSYNLCGNFKNSTSIIWRI